MKFCVNDFLLSLSLANDFIEMDILKTVTNHNKRVALLSERLGRELGLADDSIFDLVSYALMHDSGFAQSIDSFNDQDIAGLEGRKAHVVFSQRNIEGFPFRQRHDNILLYHHEHFDGSGYLGKSADEIPLYSQIITLSDNFEKLYRAYEDNAVIISTIEAGKGRVYSPDLTDAFLMVQAKTSFWLDIDDLFIGNVIDNELPKFYMDIDYKNMRKITKVFSNIIDSKSNFTATHSSGLAEKAEIMARHYGFDEDKTYKFIIAADLHDTGKLAVPNAILDKNGKLNEEEFAIIRTHTYFTRRALEKLANFEDITEWASNHHEKPDGSGYPYGFDESRLDFCSRLMTVLDIYQALTEDRPYRVGMTHEAASEILRSMADKGGIDKGIVYDVIEVFGE